MAAKIDNRMAWGISLLFFGLIYLIKQLNIVPEVIAEQLYDIKNFTFYVGIIFLIASKNKSLGLVLIGIGLLFHLPDIIRLTKNISNYVWPVLLIIAGSLVVVSSRKK